MQTALLVIDMQVSLLEDETPNRDEIVPAVQALVAAARATGAEVIWITDARVGPDGALIADLVPEKSELQIEKSAGNAFTDTDLEAELTILAVERLVICGMQSDACIDATTRGAAQNGFDVILAADAHTTHAFEGRDFRAVIADKNADLGALEQVRVLPSEEIFWQDGV
jgi:nicotinamidase-related amidase